MEVLNLAKCSAWYGGMSLAMKIPTALDSGSVGASVKALAKTCKDKLLQRPRTMHIVVTFISVMLLKRNVEK